MKVLSDFGEREIVRQFLAPKVAGLGDDCAQVEVQAGVVVITTDPVPIPAASAIGNDDDPYWAGWLLVVINASDLAAAGASPLGFVAAVECPSSWEIGRFERLIEGVSDSCVHHGLPYLGGNLKEAKVFSATGTAIGSCVDRNPLTRASAQVGGRVVLIGAPPAFWADAFHCQRGEKVEHSSPLFKPSAQIGVMSRLAERCLIQASLDNSDGLLPSVAQLAAASDVAIYLSIEQIRGASCSNVESVDPARLALGWGDWNVVAVVEPEKLVQAREICEEGGVRCIEIGVVEPGSGVFWGSGERRVPVPRLESERFAADSWFTEGIAGYFKRLLEVEIPSGSP